MRSYECEARQSVLPRLPVNLPVIELGGFVLLVLASVM